MRFVTEATCTTGVKSLIGSNASLLYSVALIECAGAARMNV